MKLKTIPRPKRRLPLNIKGNEQLVELFQKCVALCVGRCNTQCIELLRIKRLQYLLEGRNFIGRLHSLPVKLQNSLLGMTGRRLAFAPPCCESLLRLKREILTKAKSLIVNFIVSIESKQSKRSGNIVIRGLLLAISKGTRAPRSFEKDRSKRIAFNVVCKLQTVTEF